MSDSTRLASASPRAPAVPPAIVAAALAAQKKWGIPASTQIAQWQIESGSGAHSPGNNPFGMKPRKGRNDPFQMLWTSEWSALRRTMVRIQQPFRIFPTIAAAFDAHAELLATAKVYAPALAALPDRGRFIDLMASRYATDPLYATKLKAVIAAAGTSNLDRAAA